MSHSQKLLLKAVIQQIANMAHYISHLELWSENNSMELSYKKTKEIILGSIQKNTPASLCVNGNVIDTVKCFQLLGINISDNLHWDAHVDVLCKKSGVQIIFPNNSRIFKRFGLPQKLALFL